MGRNTSIDMALSEWVTRYRGAGHGAFRTVSDPGVQGV